MGNLKMRCNVWISHPCHMCYMPALSQSLWFDCTINIWCKVYFKLFTVKFSRHSYYFVPLMTNYSPQHPVFKHFRIITQKSSICFLSWLWERNHVSHPYLPICNCWWSKDRGSGNNSAAGGLPCPVYMAARREFTGPGRASNNGQL
jgi:hypothetical protein